MGGVEPKLPVALGDVIAGKYVVERIIGSGGMGVIAAARHLQLDQPVALKFLHSHVSNEQAVARFLREARATVRLKSDHVARVFDVDTLPTGEPYCVMELLEGVDLAAYSRQHGPLRIADAVEFVVQACEGIVEAHALGIVHRDLKPQNLFITRRVNGSPRLKVLDFGISKSLGAADMSLTDSTVVLGSPLYMSPEQMKASRTVDTRSDIWSLGVILYQLLTGTVPFDGETITELCLKVVTSSPRAPREMRSDIPEGLAAVVLRCLEKEPAKRFPSVAALAESLEPFSAGAERGVADRAWRSLVETADAMDSADFRAAREVDTPPNASTHSTWDKAASGGQPRRGFKRGLAVGAVVAAMLASGGFFWVSSRAVAPPIPEPASAAAANSLPAPTQSPTAALADPAPIATTTKAVLVAQTAASALPVASGPARRGRPAATPRPAARAAEPDSPAPAAAGAAAAAPDAGRAFPTTANGAPILP